MTASATLRRSIGTTATTLTLPYPTPSIVGSSGFVRTYQVYNNTASIAYLAEAKTAGTLIIAGDDILAVSDNYLTIPANSSRIFTSNIPSRAFGQSSSGTISLDFVPLW